VNFADAMARSPAFAYAVTMIVIFAYRPTEIDDLRSRVPQPGSALIESGLAVRECASSWVKGGTEETSLASGNSNNQVKSNQSLTSPP
jgi:hypothetical protein